MSRYINADEAKERLLDLVNYAAPSMLISQNDIAHKIDECQTVDAVSVVCCKDCKYCYYADNRIPNQRVYVCGHFGIDIGGSEIPNTDFYCAMGERK